MVVGLEEKGMKVEWDVDCIGMGEETLGEVMGTIGQMVVGVFVGTEGEYGSGEGEFVKGKKDGERWVKEGGETWVKIGDCGKNGRTKLETSEESGWYLTIGLG